MLPCLDERQLREREQLRISRMNASYARKRFRVEDDDTIPISQQNALLFNLEASQQEAEGQHDKRENERAYMRLTKRDLFKVQYDHCLSLCVGPDGPKLKKDLAWVSKHMSSFDETDVEWMTDELIGTDTSEEGHQERQSDFEYRKFMGYEHLDCDDSCRREHWSLMQRMVAQNRVVGRDRRVTSHWWNFRGFRIVPDDESSVDEDGLTLFSSNYKGHNQLYVPEVPVDMSESDSDDQPLAYFRPASPEVPKLGHRFPGTKKRSGGYLPGPVTHRFFSFI